MSRPRTHSVAFTRRNLLRLGAGTVATWTLGGLSPLATRASTNSVRCIFLNLIGGPSHLDTWDPKPHAPSEYRGPFRAIPTQVPGIHLSELFPRMAKCASEYALVRSIFHEAAPIHETGLQLTQTGALEYTSKSPARSSTLLPAKLGKTGVAISQGQDNLYAPYPNQHAIEAQLMQEPAVLREQYGYHSFGQSCLLARRLIEQGTQFITINMFNSVYDCLSWDCHADGASLNVNLNDYKNHIAPMFDWAYSALLLDLKSRGLLQSTLVVATGEFGRSPKINLRGGRDHWTGVWTALFAGGGVRGGQVIGASDRLGAEPADRPVHASAIANTIRHATGMPWLAHFPYGEPIHELFGRKQLANQS